MKNQMSKANRTEFLNAIRRLLNCPRRASLVEKESVRSGNRTKKQNLLRKTQTPFGSPLIVPSRDLGVLGAPLVPVNSVSYSLPIRS